MAHLAVPNPRRHWRQENVGSAHDQYTRGPLAALSNRYPQRRNVSNTNGLHDYQRPPATQTMTSELSAHRQNPVASCCCPGVPIADLNRRCNASHVLTTETALMRCRQYRCPRSRLQVVNPLPCVCAIAEPAARMGVIMLPVSGAAHAPVADHVVGLGTGKTVNYS